MLERRAGEDNFKRLQQRLLAVSQKAASTGDLCLSFCLCGINML